MKEDVRSPERPISPDRRSVHFIPFTLFESLNPADLEALSADMIVIDLEDSVKPEDKERARVALAQRLSSIQQAVKGELCIRINPLWTSEGVQDLEVFQDHILMIPKIYTQEELDKLQNLREFIPIFETLDSLRHNFAFDMLYKWKGRIKTILYGKEDLLTDIGKMNPDANSTNPIPSADLRKNWYLYTGFVELVKEVEDTDQNIEILDGISRDIGYDTQGDFKDEVRNAVMLGATGKISIYPWQIDAINDTFHQMDEGVSIGQPVVPEISVTTKNKANKLKSAQRIVEAFETNSNPQNAAAVNIDGERIIIGPPTYKLCLKLLQRDSVR